MTAFYIDSENRQSLRQVKHYKGDAKTHTFDFSAWTDDNSAVTGVTWTVEQGQATISAEALASNVASALITTSGITDSMIKLVATDGTHTEAVYLRVKAIDPHVSGSEDYGMVYS